MPSRKKRFWLGLVVTFIVCWVGFLLCVLYFEVTPFKSPQEVKLPKGWVVNEVLTGKTIVASNYEQGTVGLFDMKGKPKWKTRVIDPGFFCLPKGTETGILVFLPNPQPRKDQIVMLNEVGKVEWELELPVEHYRTPQVASGGTILLTGRDSYLYSVSQDGAIQWKVNYWPKQRADIALLDENTIVLTSGDGKVGATNFRGEIIWQLDLGRPISAYALVSSNSMAIIANGVDGNFWVTSVNSAGQKVWEHRISSGRVNYLYASPEGTVLAKSSEGLLYHFSATDGFQQVTQFNPKGFTPTEVFSSGEFSVLRSEERDYSKVKQWIAGQRSFYLTKLEHYHSDGKISWIYEFDQNNLLDVRHNRGSGFSLNEQLLLPGSSDEAIFVGLNNRLLIFEP